MSRRYIKVIAEDGLASYFDLSDKPLIVGRSVAASDIVIHDQRVSRVHLHIETTPEGQVKFMDLETANGTLLAGAAVDTKTFMAWQPGEVVLIGKTQLILQEGEPGSLPNIAPFVGERSASSKQPAERLATIEMQILSEKTSLFSRLVNAVGMVLILAVSLGLLGYVGFGEASRTYPTFALDKLAAQGEIIANTMSISLQAGLPLDQFPGFLPLSQPLLNSDESIASIYITAPTGHILFANIPPNTTTFDPQNPPLFRKSNLQKEGSHFQVSETETLYRVSLPLSSKFETVGSLHVTLHKAETQNDIRSGFVNVLVAAGVILGLFTLYVLIDIALAGRGRQLGRRVLNLSYGLAFFVMAVIVIFTLVNLYSSGIQSKTQALANSLSQRLNIPLQLGLDITDFNDLDAVFANYQTLNPDLSFIALTGNDNIIIHTDPALINTRWQSPANTFEYTLPLNRPGSFAEEVTELHVGIPTNAVYSRLWGSVKNFFVLFVAAGFLSLLFFNLMQTFIDKSAFKEGNREKVIVAQQNALLELISPFYFLAVFSEGLAASFLPQYMKELAIQANVDTGTVSTLFTIYFLSFVLALIPAGQFADRRGVKPLMFLGTLLTGISLLLMAFVTSFQAMFAIRALAGLGQGILLIGVQSYILEIATGGRKTQGAAIIVFGYNGGMISGTAIGALLAVYMQPKGVFLVGAATALLGLLYTLILIPRVAPTQQENSDEPKQGFVRNLRNAAKDFEFVKAMLFIGIPAKAVLTGVTIFALPLLLARQNYAQEDIGQIIMLYAAGVLVSSSYVSKLVDRLGRTTYILFIGTLGSGVGLVMIGLAGLPTIAPDLKTILLIVGMLLLGLAHGFIHAPIVTHISTTAAASTLGKSSATSLYRFLERIGHVSGPLIVGQLLFLSQESLIAISWLGLATIFLGILFLVRLSRRMPSQGEPKVQVSA